MNRYPWSVFIVVALCAAGLALPVAGQDQPAAPSSQQQEESVADAARRAREVKKTEPQATKVWTDENIPKVPTEEPVAEKAEGEEAAAGTEAGKGMKPAGPEDETKKTAQLEAEWRQKFAEAYKKLEMDEKALDTMQRDLGTKQLQYNNGDPQTAMRDQYERDAGAGGGGEVNTLVQKIDEKKKQIEADKQAIDDLEEALRKAGLPPGWARTP